MIGEAVVRCQCGASAKVSERTGWVWDWKTGWQCPKHFAKPITNQDEIAVKIKESISRHPSAKKEDT